MSRTPLPRRRSLSFAIAVGTLLASAAALQAHDFWLVPNAFRVAADAEVVVRGQTSSRFPTSLSAVSPERVAHARVVDAGGSTPIPDLSVEGKSLRLRFRPTTAGQKLIAVTTRPRTVRESAQGFRRYLELEGVPELLARYEREGRLPNDSMTRRYAKYAKTLVEVGDGGPRVFERAVGHPVEFVPLRDPASLRAGDTLAVRLLYRGHPLAGARVHADGVSMEPGVSDEQAAGRAHEVSATTDAGGVARIPLAGAGLWNVRTLHIVPADAGPGADWDAHWATLVFGVGPTAVSRGAASPGGGRVLGTAVAPPAGDQSDSAAVVATVERFHNALSSGDTAAVMELLTVDAMILESGGIETRAEYRSHHLPGDIAFARAVPRDRGPMTVRTAGNVAWASSTSTAQGTYRDREINSAGAELMVLTRTPAGWKIAAIHWSSRPIRPQQ